MVSDSSSTNDRDSGQRSGGRRRRRRGPKRDSRQTTTDAVEPESGEGLITSVAHGLHLPIASSEFIVFDIETTGGNPSRNGITEICALKVLGDQILDRFYTLVNPKVPIPPIVRRMTGIDNRMVANAPLIAEVMPRFLEFVGDRVVVSHNTMGDMKFLRHFAIQTCDRDMENFFLCTHLLTERYCPETTDKSLKGLSRHFKLSRADVHRAEADAHLTHELFRLLCGRLADHGIEFIDDAIRAQGDMDSAMRLGWSVDPARLQDLPQGPGLFRLFDRERKLSFVSSATNVDREIQKLRRFNQLPRPLLRVALRAYDLQAESAPSAFAAMLAEEAQLAHQSVPVHPAQWHQREVHVLGIAETKSGVTCYVGPVRPGTRWCYGPVRDHEEASAFLVKVGRALDVSMEKDDLHLQAVPGELLAAHLCGVLPARLEEARARGRSISMLWRLADRRALKSSVKVMEAVQQIGRPSWAKPMHDLSGVLVVSAGQPGDWVIHSVARCRFVGKHTFKGNWRDFVQDREQGKRLLDKIDSEINSLRETAISKADTGSARVILWWTHSHWSKSEGAFLPFADLFGKINSET